MTRTLRVLFVNENIGGHATYHRVLRSALAAFPEIVPTFLDADPPGQVHRVLGARVPWLGTRHDADGQRLRSNVLAAAVLRDRVRRAARDVDVIHVFSQNAALACVDVLRRMPSVVATDSTCGLNARCGFHEPRTCTAASLAVERLLERRVYRAATMLLPTSEWAERDMLRMGVSGARVRVVPFGIDPGPPPPVHAPAAPPQLTFIGRHLERKGGLALLDLHRRHLAERCVLNMVTPETFPAHPGVVHHAAVAPGSGGVERILDGTSVFVFPTRMDQMPNVVLEAMARGVPVVAYAAGAIPEMVLDGVAGHVVPVGDIDALRRRVESLLDDPARASAMGAAGRARVVERYDAHAATAARVRALRDAVDRFRTERAS